MKWVVNSCIETQRGGRDSGALVADVVPTTILRCSLDCNGWQRDLTRFISVKWIDRQEGRQTERTEKIDEEGLVGWLVEWGCKILY